uniref:Tumor necrosis factor alpha-induced protein 2-like n=1 Tax=Kryptolebias marmoratus TaxID=37003 RepID=A0A3Q2ZHK2_KRYMA
MPILKKLPGRSKSCHEFPRVNGELILPQLNLDLKDLNDFNDLKELNDLKDLNKNLNPFEDVDLDEDEGNGGDTGPIMGEFRETPQLRSFCDGEEEENEVNAERNGTGNPKGKPLRGTLERICGVSPLKTLGKLGKGLRISGRNVWGNNSHHYSSGDSNTLPTEKEKRKGLRRTQCAGLVYGTITILSGFVTVSSEMKHGLLFLCLLPTVLEILQLVNHRDLLLADTHIQELERECELFSNATLDSSRRKAKDVELLYEALQKEMWDVVRESLRQPSAGPNLGLTVLVIQQEEHADARPRRLKMKWRQAVAEAADWSLPHQVDTQAGQLALYLECLRSRMVDDLDAARRNAVSIYPEEFAAFQVYVESYHRAVAKRLRTITSGPLQITDVYSLLDWFYNIYNRDVLGTIGTTTPINYAPLEPILPQQTVDGLILHSKYCFKISSFQRKVEMFHETQAEFGDRGDGYVSRTIALVNCCPPLRSFVERCRQCDPQGSEESAQRANSSLDRIINQSVRVLTDRLFEHIRPFFDKLMKRKWLNNTEAFEAIEASIKQHFRKFKRMDPPPYQTLVGEVHRRVLVEYVRAIMRGQIICTSSKMKKRMAFRLQDEAKELKGLFKDLESNASWLDSIISHIADIILLEDTPSIQMEVAVLVKEFPDIRKKHVSTLLNVRGMMRQAERQEILNIVKDFECSSAHLGQKHALFSDIPITSEMHCIRLGFLRMLLLEPSLHYAPRGNCRVFLVWAALRLFKPKLTSLYMVHSAA